MTTTDADRKAMTMTVNLTKQPVRRRFLSMADRVPNGEPINDAIAAMQAEQRKPVYLNGLRGLYQVGPLAPGEYPLTTERPTWEE